MSQFLDVKGLKTYFYTRNGVVKAVDGVDFSIEKGQTLGIVGESGSGKSVSMMSLMGLIPQPPGKIVGGTAMFQGQDLLKINAKQMRKIRGDKISMIFQDPMTSLNPYLKVSTQLTEVLTAHKNISQKDALKRAITSLEQVGIPEAAERINNYPHQFSGGMRQRVMIAMALIAEPELLIADEPTTALDVTVQAQILELLSDLQHRIGMSVIMVTHDLGVVAGISDEVLVMYAGKPVERGSAQDIFYRHQHPYTSSLLRSIPRLDQDADELYSIPGLPPDPSKLPPGCPFASRCDQAIEICKKETEIPSRHFGKAHFSICHLEAKP